MTKHNEEKHEEKHEEYLEMVQEYLKNQDHRLAYLKDVAKLKKVNVHMLAEASGIHVNTILDIAYNSKVNFELELEKISIKNLIGLCNALGLSADFVRGNFESDYVSQQLKDAKLSILKSQKRELNRNKRELSESKRSLLRQVEAIEEEENVLEKKLELINMQIGTLHQ